MSTLLLAFRPGELSENEIAKTTALAPGMRILQSRDPAEIEANLDDIEIAMRDFPYALISKAPKLRWFQQWPAGADWLMSHPAAIEHSFFLTNTSGLHADCICDHVFALLLGLARNLQPVLLAQPRQEWVNQYAQRLHPRIFETAGKTMLVAGTGSIGSRIAEAARAFKLKVLGVRYHPEQQIEGVERMYGPNDLLEALPQADIVVVALPLTHQTQGMFGEKQFKAMKQGTHLINIGRGAIIDETALVKAVENGWIAGAGLDAFATEPLPPESPLWTLENVLITPHYAGNTPLYHEKAMRIFFDNLERFIKGLPLQNVVDKMAGY